MRLDDVLPARRRTCAGQLAAIAVGQHLARCEDCENAYRVLGSNPRPRQLPWTHLTEIRTCREALEDEVVTFSSAGAADPAQRMFAERLSGRLEAQPAPAP